MSDMGMSQKPTKCLRAALYARVSSKQQAFSSIFCSGAAAPAGGRGGRARKNSNSGWSVRLHTPTAGMLNPAARHILPQEIDRLFLIMGVMRVQVADRHQS